MGSIRQTIAIDHLPVRLVMSLALIAAIVCIFCGASGWMHTFLAEQQIEYQCRQLEASLRTMVQSGATRDVDDPLAVEGAKRVQRFILPDTLVFLSFGGNPDPTNQGWFTSELSGHGAAIFYKVQGGSTQVLWFPEETFRFREGFCVDSHWTLHDAGYSFILHQGGKCELIFEHVEKNHENFILIYQTDDIE
jgi:hypothetical protein